MSPEELLEELCRRIIGRPVSYHRLASNSVLLYVDGEPGSKSGVTIWLEPTWHLRSADRVLTGSREAQHDPDAALPEAGFRRAAAAIESLSGREVVALSVEAVTGDLHLELDGGYLLRTFVSDPSDEEIWHLRDHVARVSLYRSGSGYRIQHDG